MIGASCREPYLGAINYIVCNEAEDICCCLLVKEKKRLGRSAEFWDADDCSPGNPSKLFLCTLRSPYLVE
uniref:Uncharacterized protein n=1 Tax=Setaria digitata TaxID=48799 RepID=A0A915PZN1_9BILA